MRFYEGMNPKALILVLESIKRKGQAYRGEKMEVIKALCNQGYTMEELQNIWANAPM
ncbi:hypothetical protein [Paramaledivibacter caminithermalis]|uniref:Uncharacterized protein n=1 Tax=Paramaledivibacter caminithermalis (strain DSM 15212 / CIP 107654 / DViRD3) TaxID=1121301 RepID=A0A1M6K5G0_PARC5|nr:hypothetical protein [Paramaledivibacter caminithermalis]SHJ54070.1 hypothetical protein SAMN02745912_00266 [Paramaledivibacter caminithermalis DSM 15212]